MKYVSTRGKSPEISFSQALVEGLAPDGGLYVPKTIPLFQRSQFSSSLSLVELGTKVLRPFLELDPLYESVEEICFKAFNFSIPLRLRYEQPSVLELFHGPTAAFKDLGARFLAECIGYRKTTPEALKKTILVATSGDTGGAVAAALASQQGVEVLVLYPKDKISERQEKQIAGWGENIQAFAVHGTFDDCQKLVKEALLDVSWRKSRQVFSANSISIGRLLPQMVFYAMASLKHLDQTGEAPGFVIPTGNLGNAVAALLAKRVGFPIKGVVLATNANRTLADFFTSGIWQPRPSLATLANAMDVGHPNNIERLLWLYPQFRDLICEVQVVSVTDPEIITLIQNKFQQSQEVFCPHTATAFVAHEKLKENNHWILVATAHPAKFESVVEPLIGQSVPLPESMKSLEGLKIQKREIAPDWSLIKQALIGEGSTSLL